MKHTRGCAGSTSTAHGFVVASLPQSRSYIFPPTPAVAHRTAAHHFAPAFVFLVGVVLSHPVLPSSKPLPEISKVRSVLVFFLDDFHVTY
jgi:hypothetical protein